MKYLPVAHSGAGTGYARAAERNHFPGPMHVLELAEKLGISAQQRAKTQQLMHEHKRHARTSSACSRRTARRCCRGNGRTPC